MFSSYIWGLIGKFVPQLIYLVSNMILARFLTPADFGMVGVLSVFFVVSATLMDAGLSGSLIKEKTISALDCSTVFVFNFLVSLFLYFILFVFSGCIEEYFNIEGLGNIVRLISLIFVINAFGIIVSTLLIKELKFKALSNISIISALVSTIVAAILAYKGFGVYALVMFQLVQAFVRVIILYIVKPIKLSFKFSFVSFKRLIPFGIYTTLATTIDNVYENLLTFLLGKYLNVINAGYMSQAKKIEETLSNSLITTINNVSFPILSKISDCKEKFIESSNRLFKLVGMFLFPVLMTVSFFSKDILFLLFGSEWIAASSYLSVLIFAGLLMIMDSLYRNFLKSYGAVKKLATFTIYKRIIALFLIFMALWQGVQFILIAYVVSALIGCLINMFIFCRELQISINQQLLLLFTMVLPSILYYFILLGVQIIFAKVIISLICAIVLLTLYYFFFLPRFYNINILFMLKGFFIHKN